MAVKRRRILVVAAAVALLARPAWAQTVPSPAPPTPDAGATITQAPPPGSPPAPLPGPMAALPTLVPQPGDPTNVDEVVLPEKDVLILPGSSTWDEGLKNIRAAFARIGSELAKAGIAPAGKPIAVFTSTSDDDFRFDAMIPIVRPPDTGVAPPAEMRFGKTPSGKAYRFTHKGSYEEIDQTYETITTYLDAKDIVAKDAFIEEYVNDVTDPADTNLEINIFVQDK